MIKKKIRYFAGLLKSQEKWLNQMSANGYRLIKTGKLIYEFEESLPNKYQYCVDFVAEKGLDSLNNYINFLEDMDYKVFTKNINLNWSFGKITYRPFGVGCGKISTSPGSFNKELLIVEKINDGIPFQLHTTSKDRLQYVTVQRNFCLVLLGIFLLFAIFNFVESQTFNLPIISSLIFFIIILIATIIFQHELESLKNEIL